MNGLADGLLELWVGPECTINRIDERWRDQSELTGFAHRPDDFARLASLGAKRVRLPVLWERLARAPGHELDFSGSDAAMARARSAGLEPIVGLLHHGSGPRHTSLVDRHFPALFADYARRVAARYPSQRMWTPINEPLTTARFSCLYGLWYPHAEDDASFVRALLNQVHATVLAMRAIRAVNPEAQLLQTDDLGHTRCTPALADQAAFDNERRWLAFDLLCGRVDPRHPMWDWLCACGATRQELARLRDEPCPPDVVGINAYVTSERFLDERLELHPPQRHGGNGRQAYADIETVRAHGELIDGFAGRLRETHARYGLPIAITEVHMGCTREEQMRWLQQAWSAAVEARRDGVDVRAVTAWAAFGTVDWNSLLAREDGHYEPGLWDIRSDPPRLTALGALAASLARGPAARAPHPVLAGPGWWQRDLRLAVPPCGELAALPARGAPLLIVGGGALARAFARLSHMRGLPYELLRADGPQVADAAAVARLLDAHAPWALVDASGDDDIDAVETDPRRWHPNAEAPAVLAAACAHAGVRLLVVSSDLVFPGRDGAPYLESDAVGPVNAYGRAKAHAERAVLACAPDALVVRSGGLFGPWDAGDFLSLGLARLRDGEPWRVAHDHVLSPTYLPDLVQAALDLLIDGERGLWHLTHGEPLSWADLAARAADGAGLRPELVLRHAGVELGHVARRPGFSALSSERGMLLPSLDDALSRYPRDHEPVPAPPPPLRTVA
jgi:dTDP-4-dehydrorhamnose reductase